MKTKIKTVLILFLLTGFFTASAVTIIPLQEGFFAKIWRCKWHLNCYQQKLGATITTIAGTDTISSSRTTINTNFSNLNDGKIENSSSSIAAITTLSNLASVGTLTTGTWSASTLTVSKGGTGSTTLSSNQILLGNGTGIITTVSGFGSSGQFLTSNGTGAAPSWTTSSIDQTINYGWTGNHNFTGTTLIKKLNASSTSANPIVLNGVSFNTPSSDGASSTVLMTNGAGKLLWDNPKDMELLADETLTSASSTWTVAVPDRKFYYIIFRLMHDTQEAIRFRFNSVSLGYADRYSQNGGVDTTDVSQNAGYIGLSELPLILSGTISFDNSSTTSKTFNTDSSRFSVAGTAPTRLEIWHGWAGASTTLGHFNFYGVTGQQLSGSHIIIYGSKSL